MNKKITSILLIGFLALTTICAFLPQSKADTTYMLAWNNYADDEAQAFQAVHPTSTGAASAVSQAFQVVTTGYIENLLVTVRNLGINDAYLEAKIEVITGTYGTNAKTNETVLATSLNTFHTTVLNSPLANWYTAQFEFNRSILLTAGQQYIWTIYVKSATVISATNYTHILGSNVPTGYGGNYGMFLNSAWSASNSYDFNFIINGYLTDGQPTPTPSPSPTPTDDYKWDENTNSWSWWNGTHWIPSSGPSPTANAQIVTFTGNMIDYIVPLLLLLLPAVVGAWALGKAGAAKWGFIAGLNIGAIMCYLYLPDFGLWAVIAIVLVDIVMIFASQRGGD